MDRSWLQQIMAVPEAQVTTRAADDDEARIADIEALAQRVLGPLPARQTTARLSRRPFFVEFAGTPRAGKTTAIDLLDRILRRNRYRVRVVAERASTSPLRNKHDPFFNLWTAATTLAQILESQDRDDHIVLIDRGIFDALCWMDWFRSSGNLAADEYETITNFLSMPRIRRLTDLVFVLTVSPAQALDREASGQLTSRHGAIMNPTTLADIGRSVDNTMSQYGSGFTHEHMDTTGADQIAVLERMARVTLGALDRFLRSVLVLPRSAAGYLPQSGFVADPSTIERFLADIDRYGEFMTRDEAEARADYVQPIPIAYLLHGDRAFVFHRSDQDTTHRLHGRFMIWAGGHVRRDDIGEDPIGDALMREMQEELYLPIGLAPEVVGLVMDSSDPRSRMHVGVVHRMRVEEPNLARTMDERLFVEARGGSSMTSRLVGAGGIARYWPGMEEWSKLILTEHLRWPAP
jgi:predicted NUDIX family phosphoesterase/thymidylate kinase